MRLPKINADGNLRSAVATGACLLAVGMAFLDVTIVNVAFPSIQAAFPGHDLATLSWVLNAYAVVFAALLAPLGRLADVVGRRRVFLAGLALFTCSSAACGAAPSVGLLIAARGVQAIGGAAMVPTSLALLLAGVAPERRPVRVGLWSAAAGAAGGLGPLLGGALIDAADWRLAFAVNVPLGAAAIAAARWATREEQSERGERGLPDLFGSALLAGAAGLLAGALVEGNSWGWLSARVGFALAGALTLGAWFVRRSRRRAVPAIDLGLLALPTVRRSAVVMVLFASAFYGLILASVLVLALLWRYSVLDVGLAIAPGPILAALTAVITGRMSTTRGPRRFAVAGMALYAASTACLASTVGAHPNYLHFVVPFLFGGIAVGLTMPSVAAASVSELPAEQFAVGAAINLTARQFGAVLGVAVLIAVLGSATSPTVSSLRDGMLAMAALAGTAAICGLRLPGGRQTRATATLGRRRERVITWQDPEPGSAAALTMSGLEYLRAIARGEHAQPPIADLMGISGVEADEGRVLFRGEPGEHHLNPIGAVHGGFAATLMDSALGCAVHSTLPAGVGYTTIDLALTFVGRITPATGPVLCEGTVIHRGRTIATAGARLTRESDGRLLAHASTTCLILTPAASAGVDRASS